MSYHMDKGDNSLIQIDRGRHVFPVEPPLGATHFTADREGNVTSYGFMLVQGIPSQQVFGTLETFQTTPVYRVLEVL